MTEPKLDKWRDDLVGSAILSECSSTTNDHEHDSPYFTSLMARYQLSHTLPDPGSTAWIGIPAFWREVIRSIEKDIEHRHHHIASRKLVRSLRFAIRMGAPHLACSLAQATIAFARFSFPTPRTLSVAAGLISEYALWMGSAETAAAYALEGLHWGHERHRMRTYLSYARTLESHPESDLLNELDNQLSQRAISRQQGMNPRGQYIEFHNLKLALLKHAVTDSRPDHHQIINHYDTFTKKTPIENLVLQPILRICIRAALPGTEFPETLSDDMHTLLQEGRARDILFAEAILGPTLDTALHHDISHLVTQLDEIDCSFQERLTIVDDPFLATLKSKAADPPNLAKLICLI